MSIFKFMVTKFFFTFSAGIKYDPIKEEKQLMEAKQQELKRIEEAKQKVVDQGKLSVNSGNKG